MHHPHGPRLRPTLPGIFIAGLLLAALSCQSTDSEPTDTDASGGAAATGGDGPASGGTSATGGRTTADGGADALGGQASGGEDALGGEGGAGTREGSGGAEQDCFSPSHQIKCVDDTPESTVCFTPEQLSNPCSVVHLLSVHPVTGEADPSDLGDEQLQDEGDTDSCPAAEELFFGRFRCGRGVTPACENAVRRVGNACCYVAFDDALLC